MLDMSGSFSIAGLQYEVCVYSSNVFFAVSKTRPASPPYFLGLYNVSECMLH